MKWSFIHYKPMIKKEKIFKFKKNLKRKMLKNNEYRSEGKFLYLFRYFFLANIML